MTAPKILVVGAVRGQLRKALEKIAKLHSKNDFAFAIAVGDLFSLEGEDEDDLAALLDGTIKAAIPLYFTLGDSTLPSKVIERIEASDLNDVAPNVHFLGRKATLQTAYGIKIVALGGKLVQSDLAVQLGRFDPLYYESEARELCATKSAHILITNQWPEGVVQGSSTQFPEVLRTDLGTKSISDLCAQMKPRYHFASSPEATWEREPFKHPQDYESLDEPMVTRFRSLASIDLSAKDWMSAFSLDPALPPPAANATSSPFINRKRRAELPQQQQVFSRFSGSQPHHQNGLPRKRHKHNVPDECFMCLNQPGFKDHMVVSVGPECLNMVTVAKGPLPKASTFPELSWNGHLLIVPTYHAGDNVTRSSEEVRLEYEEFTKYRKAVYKMLMKLGQGKLGAVCWETNRTGIRHMHWQLLATPASLIHRNLVITAFKALAKNYEYPPFQSCEPDILIPNQQSDYFRVWIWSPPPQSEAIPKDPIQAATDTANGAEDDDDHDHDVNNTDNSNENTKSNNAGTNSTITGTETSIYFSLPPDLQSFKIWFGREVMAKLMKLGDERIDWRSCIEGVDEEKQDADRLRADFAEFDLVAE